MAGCLWTAQGVIECSTPFADFCLVNSILSEDFQVKTPMKWENQYKRSIFKDDTRVLSEGAVQLNRETSSGAKFGSGGVIHMPERKTEKAYNDAAYTLDCSQGKRCKYNGFLSH